MTHRCRAWLCEQQVTSKYLMCWKHWRLVPKNVQQAVVLAYVQYKSDRAGYVRACRAATRSVAAIEGHEHTKAGGCWCVVKLGDACEAAVG